MIDMTEYYSHYFWSRYSIFPWNSPPPSDWLKFIEDIPGWHFVAMYGYRVPDPIDIDNIFPISLRAKNFLSSFC